MKNALGWQRLAAVASKGIGSAASCEGLGCEGLEAVAKTGMVLFWLASAS